MKTTKSKKTILRRITSTLLAVTLLFGIACIAPASASAAGNTISAATSYTMGSTVNGSITSSDLIDYYKFTLSSSGTVTLNYNSNLFFNKLEIYDASNSRIWNQNIHWDYSLKSLSYNEKIALTSGTYYFKISGEPETGKTNGKYNFKFTFASAGESFRETQGGSNNTFEKASSINLNTKYNAQRAANDKIDYFKFTLPSSGTILFSLDASFKEAQMKIYDASKRELWSSTRGWDYSSNTLIYSRHFTLTSGTYYFAVTGRNDYHSDYFGKYNFKISFEPSNETFRETQGGSNNTFEKASNISLNTRYYAQYAINDNVDYFKFTLSGSGTVTLSLNSYFYETYMKLYDASRRKIWEKTEYWNSSTKSMAYSNKITLNSGTYYFEVSGYDNVYREDEYGKYSFSIGKALPAPASVKLNRGTLGLGTGEVYGLLKTISPSNANQSATWTSSNTSVATVDSNGKVTGRKTGTATVTVRTSNGKTASCKVTVKYAPASVSTNPAKLTLGNGETYTISENTSAGSYANAANLRWTSSNTNVVTVTKQNGTNRATLKATRTGTAYITIKTYNGKTASCTVTVKSAPKTVSVTKTSLKLKRGQTYTIAENTNAGSYANAANLRWTSSNNSAATVSKSGGNKAIIKAVKPGTANITIRLYNGKTATCKVTVI